MLCLLLGDDRIAKDQKIDALKKKYLPSLEALSFDYISVQVHQKLDPDGLKKKLLDLPAVAKKRVVLLTMAQKLNDQHKQIIIDFLKTSHDHLILIIDSDQEDSKNAFIKELKYHAQKEIFFFSTGVKKTVWNMIDAIKARKQAEALNILSQLFDDVQEAPVASALKIMGALIWAWGDMKKHRRLSSEQFKKGLLVLQEADLNIKRTRMDVIHAVEICVIKLSCLLTS
ncbi:MAG TPA: hypothetical protein PLH56_00610 [Candidatus Omnitrophota bacterium]|nr:hypothetical protein [Candidatus Omnitrophota bacterium]HPN87824.1 hypothetical protein [Candidatus Omnitrophota bacterium]